MRAPARGARLGKALLRRVTQPLQVEKRLPLPLRSPLSLEALDGTSARVEVVVMVVVG